MLIVCWLCSPALWQTSTFSCPAPASPVAVVVVVEAVVVAAVVVVGNVVVVVGRVVVVVVCFLCLFLAGLPFFPASACDWVVVSAANGFTDEPVVTCARPTPAIAANASPTTAPTTERRLIR